MIGYAHGTERDLDSLAYSLVFTRMKVDKVLAFTTKCCGERHCGTDATVDLVRLCLM